MYTYSARNGMSEHGSYRKAIEKQQIIYDFKKRQNCNLKQKWNACTVCIRALI